MKTISLSIETVALVDDNDYELLKEFNWIFKPRSDGRGGYAFRYIKVGPHRYKRVLMHNHILTPPKGLEVDHKNGNGLDNRRNNLRIATRSQQGANTRKVATISKTSVFKGVGKASKNRWRARIRVNGLLIDLGHFEKEEDAAKAYNQAALHYFGNFALINKV